MLENITCNHLIQNIDLKKNRNFINEKELFETYEKSMNKRQLINLFVNLLAAFTLSFAIYLLIINIFFTYVKFQIDNVPFSSIDNSYYCGPHISSHECSYQMNYLTQQYNRLKSEQNLKSHEPLAVNTSLYVF
jgi:hypothetical protein